jgi:hypothetical protein
MHARQIYVIIIIIAWRSYAAGAELSAQAA